MFINYFTYTSSDMYLNSSIQIKQNFKFLVQTSSFELKKIIVLNILALFY